MPISFISRIGRVAKIANAPTITIAALVTVPAVALIQTGLFESETGGAGN